MAAIATRTAVPTARIPRVDGPLRRVWPRLTAAQLDIRLATGQATARVHDRSRDLVMADRLAAS
jgi:hypothetical protein